MVPIWQAEVRLPEAARGSAAGGLVQNSCQVTSR
jgi:hypothetical protein